MKNCQNKNVVASCFSLKPPSLMRVRGGRREVLSSERPTPSPSHFLIVQDKSGPLIRHTDKLILNNRNENHSVFVLQIFSLIYPPGSQDQGGGGQLWEILLNKQPASQGSHLQSYKDLARSVSSVLRVLLFLIIISSIQFMARWF